MCVAIPRQVVAVGAGCADIRDGERTRTVATAGLPDLRPGDFVLVHAGAAIERLSADEAADLLALQAILDDSVALDALFGAGPAPAASE